MIWEKLHSEYLFKDQWLTVRKDTVKLPDGPVIPSYYVLEYPDWISVIGLTKDKKMILLKQYRHGIGKVAYELCGGMADAEDASPLEAAKREMLEESGYGKGKWEEWMVVSANPSMLSNLTYCYLATDLELVAEQQLDETEQISVHLFELEEVKRMLLNNQFLQALHVAPLWKFFFYHFHDSKVGSD